LNTDLRDQDQEVIAKAKVRAEEGQSEHRELIRLRGQLTKLRKIEQENARLSIERDRLALRRKQRFARDLGTALIVMAERNDNRFPTELSAEFLTLVDAISLGSTDSISGKAFELVYKGSFHFLLTSPKP